MFIMMSPRLSVFLASLTASTCLASGYNFNKALDTSNGLQPRALQAAARPSDIARRGSNIPVRNNVVLHYADVGYTQSVIHKSALILQQEPSHQHKTPLGATVSLSSSRPTIVLEEIDHHLHEIHCEEGLMHLETEPLLFSEANRVFELHPEIVIITSHESCNDRGSRVPYLYVFISQMGHGAANSPDRASLSNAFDSTNTFELGIMPITWRDAYSMKVDYGVDYTDYKINAHDNLSRRGLHPRQDITSTAVTTPAVTTIPVSTVSTLSGSSQVAFPAPTTTTASNTTIVESFSKSFIDAPILPINGSSAANGFKVDGNGFPTDLALNCQNCTFVGNLQLTSGSFSTSNSSNSSSAPKIIGDIEKSIDFIENGFILVTANELFAHVDLSAAWPQDFSKSINVTLLDLPLDPFSIPDIAIVGPELRINLLLSAAIGATANLSYGFEVNVPPNSTALADINQVNRSSISGFGNTNFSALPFSAHVSDISLNLSATIQPEVLVGISFFDGKESAGAGVFLNLPTLSLSVDQVNGTDQNCDPTTNQTIIQDLNSEYDALINIVPNVAIGAGFVVQASAAVPGLATLADQRAFTPLATTFAPPTACLAFDKSSSAFVSPTLPPANAASATVGAGGSEANGGPGQQSSSPASGGLGHSKTVIDAAVVNAAVVGCLVLLGPLFVF